MIEKYFEIRKEIEEKLGIPQYAAISYYGKEKHYYNKFEVLWVNDCLYCEDIRGVSFEDDKYVIYLAYNDDYMVFLKENVVNEDYMDDYE